MKILRIVSLFALVGCFGACQRHSAESTEHFRIQQLPKSEQKAYLKAHDQGRHTEGGEAQDGADSSAH